MERERVDLLDKARAINDTIHAIDKVAVGANTMTTARDDAAVAATAAAEAGQGYSGGGGRRRRSTRVTVRQKIMAITPLYLKDRVKTRYRLPRVEVNATYRGRRQGKRRMKARRGVEGEQRQDRGEEGHFVAVMCDYVTGGGLLEELYIELMKLMVPSWM